VSVPRLTTAALLLATACSATEDVTLDLTDTDGDCTADVLALVKTLSIEAIASEGRCRLAHQCAFDVDARTVADVEAALRGTDVLLELPAGDAQILVVNGRPTFDCFPREDGSNQPVVCGSANLGQARSGALEVELHRATAANQCLESIPLCP
jgi:hypothetical protein